MSLINNKLKMKIFLNDQRLFRTCMLINLNHEFHFLSKSRILFSKKQQSISSTDKNNKNDGNSSEGKEESNQPLTRKQEAEKDREYWLTSHEATQFENDPNSRGPFYITKDPHRPFPLNPLYIAKRPLDNDTRNDIFRLWKEDSKKWTPKKLGLHFGISVIRVEAILRLKAQEEQYKNLGFAIQESLSSNMDRLLGAQRRVCTERPHPEPLEKLRPHLMERLRPFFAMLSETESMKPEDAAQMLKKNPFMNKVQKLDTKASKVFTLQPEKDAKKCQIIQKDSKTTSKFNFVITNPETKEIFIREKEGVLRTATALERWNIKNVQPAYRHQK